MSDINHYAAALCLALLTAWCCLAFPAPAAAQPETRTFKNPQIRGVRLDWCKHLGRDCGQPAADLFCKEFGFEKAKRFRIARGLGADRIPTVVFGDGRLCRSAKCDGFSSITCARKVRGGGGRADERPEPRNRTKRPSLARCLDRKCEQTTRRPHTIPANEDSAKLTFTWSVKGVDEARRMRWQVSRREFEPRRRRGRPLSPRGLVDWGSDGGKDGRLRLDFAKLHRELPERAQGAPRTTFYLRILPMKGSDLVGPPSNVITIRYRPAPND